VSGHKSPWKGERSTEWEREKYTHTHVLYYIYIVYINTQVVWLYGIKATFTTRPQLDPNYTHTHTHTIPNYYYYYYYRLLLLLLLYYYYYYYYYYCRIRRSVQYHIPACVYSTIYVAHAAGVVGR